MALAAVAAIPAVGALLVGAVFVLPAAAARLLARSVPGAARLGRGARAGGGVRRASTSPTGSTRRPGPPIAVLGAAVYGALAIAAGLAGRPPAAVTP